MMSFIQKPTDPLEDQIVNLEQHYKAQLREGAMFHVLKPIRQKIRKLKAEIMKLRDQLDDLHQQQLD